MNNPSSDDHHHHHQHHKTHGGHSRKAKNTHENISKILNCISKIVSEVGNSSSYSYSSQSDEEILPQQPEEAAFDTSAPSDFRPPPPPDNGPTIVARIDQTEAVNELMDSNNLETPTHLFLNGYNYYRHTTYKDTTYYKCVQKNCGCLIRVNNKDCSFISQKKPHICNQNMPDIAVLKQEYKQTFIRYVLAHYRDGLQK